MKVVLNISVFVVLFTLGLPCAQAGPTLAELDLTSSASGSIADAVFVTYDLRSAGTGVFHPFLRIGSNDLTVDGYNTDARPIETGFESKVSPHTRALPLAAVPVVTISGNDYFEFLLDINQKGGPKDSADPAWYLSLDRLEVAIGTTPDASSYSTIFAPANLIYTLPDESDPTDWRILLDSRISSGSGQADLAAYIPVPKVLPAGDYIYLYSMFGQDGDYSRGDFFNNDGFEEWAIQTSYPLPVIPAPGAALLAGLGAGFVGWLRKRKTL